MWSVVFGGGGDFFGGGLELGAHVGGETGDDVVALGRGERGELVPERWRVDLRRWRGGRGGLMLVVPSDEVRLTAAAPAPTASAAATATESSARRRGWWMDGWAVMVVVMAPPRGGCARIGSSTAAWWRGLATPSLSGRSSLAGMPGLCPEVGGPVADRSPMSLSVLGPLEVVRGGAPVQLGGPQQRRVLAVLAVHANEVVSSDRLIEVLWGEVPPASASHTLQALVSRLRSALGTDRVETVSPGYRLQVEVGRGRWSAVRGVGAGGTRVSGSARGCGGGVRGGVGVVARVALRRVRRRGVRHRGGGATR